MEFAEYNCQDYYDQDGEHNYFSYNDINIAALERATHNRYASQNRIKDIDDDFCASFSDSIDNHVSLLPPVVTARIRTNNTAIFAKYWKHYAFNKSEDGRKFYKDNIKVQEGIPSYHHFSLFIYSYFIPINLTVVDLNINNIIFDNIIACTHVVSMGSAVSLPNWINRFDDSGCPNFNHPFARNAIDTLKREHIDKKNKKMFDNVVGKWALQNDEEISAYWKDYPFKNPTTLNNVLDRKSITDNDDLKYTDIDNLIRYIKHNHLNASKVLKDLKEKSAKDE